MQFFEARAVEGLRGELSHTSEAGPVVRSGVDSPADPGKIASDRPRPDHWLFESLDHAAQQAAVNIHKQLKGWVSTWEDCCWNWQRCQRSSAQLSRAALTQFVSSECQWEIRDRDL